MTESREHRRRPWHAIALFFLAPLVGEYLLGNQPITALPSVLLLAPMYGAGALPIRELTRRTGRGWPTVLLLAAAYSLIEEGPVDQMLWNPRYGGVDMGLAYAETYVPALGTSVALVQDVLSMHTIWSICVPIAIIETFDGDHRSPWLGRIGLAVTGAVFVGGCAFLAVAQYDAGHFMAPPSRLIGAVAVIAVLVVTAFALGRRPARRLDAAAPSPWAVGVAAFGGCSLYWLRETLLPDGTAAWVPVGAWFVLAGVFVVLCARWSRSRGWGPAHHLALAGGALLTYVWLGFTHAQDLDVPPGTALLGNVVFGGGAVVLLAAAAPLRRAPLKRPGADGERASDAAEGGDRRGREPAGGGRRSFGVPSGEGDHRRQAAVGDEECRARPGGPQQHPARQPHPPRLDQGEQQGRARESEDRSEVDTVPLKPDDRLGGSVPPELLGQVEAVHEAGSAAEGPVCLDRGVRQK
uniref:hypothetical protein n=1 Tax=Nonomuraea pusilla TaxID=46177 RepID=UPI001F24BA74|nr:hypothetical protein [Nonomuraea pusilla]